MMPHPAVSDAAPRLRAIDPAQSFLVEAPAGSGKTELLIQRYLCLLARVSQPESIVALTFTRKAAAEMKERVLAALHQAAEGTAVTTVHQKQTRSLAETALARNRHEDWNITESSNRIEIGTIDSFCSLLTRQMPLLAKLGSTPRVLEYADELYYLAARQTIVEIAQNEAFRDVFHHAAIHFDGKFSWLQELIVIALRKRDQWIRKIALHEGDDLRSTIDSLLGQDLTRRLGELALLWPSNLPGRPPVNAPSLNDWIAAADCHLLTGKKEPRKKSPYYGTLENNPGFCEALHRCRKFVSPPISDGEWCLIHNFTAILRIALQQLEIVFREHGAVDFTRISQSAVEALGTRGEPTELGYRLDFRIEHILVDEFQDTSRSQFDLLERLTAQWSPGDGRTLFLVGDPMQSIYQFRDADVSLFIQAAEQGIGDLRPERVRLQENFRSTKSIVEWVEKEFTRIAPVPDNMETGAVALRPTTSARTAKGRPPHIHRFIDDNGSAEAEKIVEIAQDSLARGYSTAILVRARTHLAAILPALRGKVPFEAVDLDALTTEQHILDLLSLTRAIHQLADRVAWLACLRAPFCGLTLADLATLFESRRDRTIVDVLFDETIVATLPPPAQARVRRFTRILSSAISNFGRMPLRGLVEATWIALGGAAALDAASQRDDAANFFDLLETSSPGGRISDFALFNERLTYLFAHSTHHSPSRVQIMTIHKAKGLQFDTVIVPQLGRFSGRTDVDLMVWSTPPGSRHSLAAGVPPIDADSHSFPPYYKLVKEQGRQKEQSEEARLFYVAATRAKEELHLLANVATKRNGQELAEASGFLKLIWPTEQPHFQAELVKRLARQSSQQFLDLSQAPSTILRRLPASWALPSAAPSLNWVPPYAPENPSERKPSYDWVSETGRHAGSVVHNFLRTIAEQGISEWPASRVASLAGFARSELEAAGVPFAETPAAVDRVIGALRNVLGSERGRWILSPHTASKCEWALSGRVGHQLISARIDRTFLDETGVRWIIDYKTSSHEGAGRTAFLQEERARYESQLSLYAQLFQASGETNISLGLYFPLLDEWIAWPAPKSAITAHPTIEQP